jgi:flagellin-specific chaperone FliS
MAGRFEKKLNKLRLDAKETYDALIDSSALFDEYMSEEDIEEKDELINEMYRIRKALKDTITTKDKITGVKTEIVRPNTEAYLNKIAKKLKDVSKDIDELFAAYCPSDEEEEEIKDVKIKKSGKKTGKKTAKK